MAPAHSHDHYEETIYGIEGVLTWTVDGKRIDVGPGQALCIPRGAVHRFDNNGTEDVKCLCVITPAAIGPQYFRETAEAVSAAAGGPPDRAKMVEIMLPPRAHSGSSAADVALKPMNLWMEGHVEISAVPVGMKGCWESRALGRTARRQGTCSPFMGEYFCGPVCRSYSLAEPQPTSFCRLTSYSLRLRPSLSWIWYGSEPRTQVDSFSREGHLR